MLPPFTFGTDFPVDSVTITTQPANSGDVNIGDNASTSPVIKVKNAAGTGLQNYMVTSFIVAVDQKTGEVDKSTNRVEGMFDPYTSTFQNLLDNQSNAQ